MEKTNGYYVAKYLKNNALVLICELVVVLLLSLICTIIMEAEPLWLAPLIAVVTYLVAELRFMMAYVATNARHEHDMAVAKGEIEADEPSQETEDAGEAEPTEQADEDPATDETAEDEEDAPFVAPALVPQDEDEQPAEEYIDEESAEEATEEAAEEVAEEATQEDAEEDEDVAEPVVEQDEQDEAEEQAPAVKGNSPREVKFQLRKIFGAKKEKAEKVEEAEPVFDDAPAQEDLPEDEDEEMDALFDAAPTLTPRAPALTLESIDLEDDEQDDITMDDMTMDGDDFARDVLEIGEIGTATAEDKEQ